MVFLFTKQHLPIWSTITERLHFPQGPQQAAGAWDGWITYATGLMLEATIANRKHIEIDSISSVK